MKSINTFGTHAPKTEWLVEFFERKDEFLADNGLGPVQKPFFRRFLRDAGLIAEGKSLPLTDKLALLGWDSPTSLGIILSNIAYNPQFTWYIKNIEVGRFYTRKDLENVMLVEDITDEIQSVSSDINHSANTFSLNINSGYVDNEDNFYPNKLLLGHTRGSHSL